MRFSCYNVDSIARFRVTLVPERHKEEKVGYSMYTIHVLLVFESRSVVAFIGRKREKV